MIIKTKKYIAKVADYVEHEDGTITKETTEIEIKGKRMSEAGVLKQIPRTAKLIKHGYIEEAYEVDSDNLAEWLKTNGKRVDNE